MIYFDNAATTFPKPPSVISEMLRCMTSYCGNPGRSGHALSVESARKIYDCREALAEEFGASVPTNVVFTPNTTYALNLAINALVRKKTHVLISDVEHNSVYRTVVALSKQSVDFDIFTVDPYSAENTLRSIRSKLRPSTSLLVCAHVSNVCGITLPIEDIGKLCRRYGIRFIVDGAQSAGTHPINMTRCSIDALCCPGHKGLYGPQGTGFVIFADKYADEKLLSRLPCFVHGGNGVNSADSAMPVLLPERYEGGTLNTVGIVGLGEGLSFVKQRTPEGIFSHVSALYRRGVHMVSSLPRATVYYGDLTESSCLLFNVNGIDSDRVADLLNDRGICVRGGLHCSPLVHKKLGTSKGAVRASFSVFNTLPELEAFYSAMKDIVRNH